MKKYLIPHEGNFYKANLHCHSTISDGKMTVEELKEAYMKEGYSIIAYTDHSKYVPHNDLSDEKFLAINSYEEDISDWAVKDSRIRRCYHFNCYDKDPSGTKDVVLPLPEYNDIDGINEYIDRMNKAGFLVCYNHPNWSLQTLDDYGKLKGLFATEVFNFSAYIDGIDGNQEVPYDSLLRAGNRLFCVATDDNHDNYELGHPLNDSFGGFIWVKAESLDYRTVIEALEKGNFYASMGPEIKELYIEDGKVHLECSPARRITLTNVGRRSEICRARKGETISSADFTVDPDDKFIRIQIEDEHGLRANTNAYFVEDIL
ncbi:MAG: PHP domain-containing protein [Clostridia bacterium]|nr:PHP domain-containing protein [Clostridia bacterium]